MVPGAWTALWRFEIDDSAMEYDPTGDLQGAKSRRWAMEDLEAAREDLFGNITEEQANMVRAYNRAENRGRHGGSSSASMTN